MGRRDGIRVVRKGEQGATPARWAPLQLSWAVSDELVGARHVCGGWFRLAPEPGAGLWHQWAVESAWYVTEGSLDLGWRDPAGESWAPIGPGSFVYVPPGTAFALGTAMEAAGLVLFGGTPSPDRLVGETGPGGEGRPWLARVDELPSDADYEPPLDMRWGVTDRLGGSRLLCGARTLDPPRGRIQHHYHTGAEAVIFFLRGTFRLFSGPAREAIDVGPGDVAYIAPGVLHSYCSLEEEQVAEEVAFYGGVASKEAAGTVFVESPWCPPPGRAPVARGSQQQAEEEAR